MTTYRVFRRGFNAANNSSRGARPEDCTQHVATVEAESEEAAVQAALGQGVTVYNGQSVWAEEEQQCQAKEEASAAEHVGQVLVKYWQGTTAVSEWCSTVEEIDECLERHQNSYPPRFYDADEEEIDYEEACNQVA
jgi:hypothetical protein